MSSVMTTPRVLYKYRSLAGKNRDYTKRLIVDRELYFASVDEFNDPFDCRASIVVPRATPEQWKEFGLPRRPPRELREKMMAEKGQQVLLESVRKLGIFCSTSDAFSILMWSYYTLGHTGVCLGFRTSTGSGSPLWDSRPVEYSDVYPSYNPLRREAGGEESVLIKKAKPWEHESEWRAFNSDGHGVVRYEQNVLKEVVLGCRIRPKDRDDILKWIGASGQAITVLQARQHSDAFRLEIEPG